MKVILQQDVAKIGRKGDVAEVPNGYAMNELIPKGKATPATAAAIKQAEQVMTERAAHASDAAEAFAAACAQLKDTPLSITADMNEQEHLFQAVSAADVVAAAAAAGVTIDPAMVQFAEPIKAAGEHTVSLQSGDQTGTCTVHITKADTN